MTADPVKSHELQRYRSNTPNQALQALHLAIAEVPTVYPLTATESAELAAIARLHSTDPITHPTAFAVQSAALAARLPVGPAVIARRFRLEGNSLGALIFRGVPVESEIGRPNPPTPLDNTKAIGAGTLLAKSAAIIASGVGELVSYQAEGHGSLLQDMTPNPDKVDAQESQGSGIELEAHTEQMFSELRPDYVLLACLRGDDAAKTYVCSARKLIAQLSDAEVAMLREPLWTTTIDASFQPYLPNPKQIRGPWPIITGPSQDPAILIDQDLQRGITAAAEALLRKLIHLYIEHRDHHVLQAGDVLLLDNRRAMHGRSPFAARLDGTDRFIVRGFIMRDLARSDFARIHGSRQIRAEYS